MEDKLQPRMTRKRSRAMAHLNEIKELITYCTKADVFDGDGHSIFLAEHYLKGSPAKYHSEIEKLVRCHRNGYCNDGSLGPTGIWALEFHFWLASKIKSADKNFTFEHKIGKGFQAQTIFSAAHKWAENLPVTGDQ